MLLRRLNDFALDRPDPRTKRPIEMTDTQVRAALGLLRKTLPDLAVTQIEGGNVPLVVDFRWADGADDAKVTTATTAETIDGVAEQPAADQLTIVWEGEDG